MWLEEGGTSRVNQERAQQLLSTGASTIATACPFCYIMLDDAVKGEMREDVHVTDIATALWSALNR
jgi:Fe-S oxidoreductase